MMKNIFYRLFFLLLFSVSTSFILPAQEWRSLGDDEIFLLARKKALEGKYEEARSMFGVILEHNAAYHDARIFIARTYAWEKNYSQARKELQQVLATTPFYEDALVALADVEIWDSKFDTALLILNNGLTRYPNSEELLFRKATTLKELSRTDESMVTLNDLLTVNPAHGNGVQLLEQLRSSKLKYTVGFNYTVDIFSQVFQPAQYANMHINRLNKWGTSIFRLNYSDRFSSQGWQPEIDLYPRITKGVYAYLNYGYSNSNLFPNHRLGGEIYSKVLKNFEASLGMRYLYYTTNNSVPIYTGSVGWYVKSFWISYRPYFSSVNSVNSFSSVFTARKYLKDADNFIGLTVGFGFSPDDRRLQSANGISTDGIYILKSQRAGLAWQKSLPKNFSFTVSFNIVRQELSFSQNNYTWISSPSIWVRKKF